MTGTLSKRTDGQTDGQANRQTEMSVLRAVKAFDAIPHTCGRSLMPMALDPNNGYIYCICYIISLNLHQVNKLL